MLEAIGGISGGIGLFFVGMWLLSENLKSLASRRLRLIAANWVPNHFIAFGYGVLAGGATQSMSYLTFVTVGILRANLITTERALPFIVGGNVGVISIVFFVSFDIELAALYILGPASLFMVIERSLKFHTLGALLFGLALMFVGLALIKDSAASFSTQPWFGEFLELAARSLWISFLLAAILTFIVQSAVAVMVFGITLGAIGVLTADQVIMLIYGSAIGSSLSVLALSLDRKGVSRWLAMFQVMFNLVSCAIFVPMFYIELWTGAPLMKALILTIPLELASQLAMLSILTEASTAILMLALMPLMVKVYSRLWPATAIDRLSQVEFVHSRAYGAVAVALELAALEQKRVLGVFSSYLDAVRQGRDIEALRNSIRPVILGCVDILVMMLVCQMLSCQQNSGTGFSISCVAAPACMSLRKKIASDLSRPFCGLTAPAPNGGCFRPNTGIGTVSINDSPVGLTKASGNRCFNISPATRTWNT